MNDSCITTKIEGSSNQWAVNFEILDRQGFQLSCAELLVGDYSSRAHSLLVSEARRKLAARLEGLANQLRAASL